MRYYEAIKAALSDIPGVKLYHNKACKQDSDYIVWYEINTSGLHADGRIVNASVRLAVDFFTKGEYSDIPRDIIRAMERTGFAVSAETEINYEENTGWTHYAMTAVWG